MILNVANLYPEHFARIISGIKRTEWRQRRRMDPILEQVSIGERLLLLETGGSIRGIITRVRAILRFDRHDGTCVYAIRLCNPKLDPKPHPERRMQGWRRIQI